MIFYAQTPTQGTQYLEETYALRPTPPEEYLPEKVVRRLVPDLSSDEFFAVLGASATMYAYVLDDMRLYVHPDAVVRAVCSAHCKYFSTLV